MTFGEKLYQLRKAHGLSQEALAEKLNTSRQAVSKWENDNGYPETEKMVLLARLFQVSLDDLLMEDREIGGESNGTDRKIGNQDLEEREGQNGYYVNRETANGFLLYYKRKFLLIAAACGLMLGCNAVSYSSTEPGFYELAVEPFLTVVSAMALLSIVFYIVLKQNPYRNLRNRELFFSEEVRKELLGEFGKMKKVLLAGIIASLAAVGINEAYFSIHTSWESLFLLSDAEILCSSLFDMILVGICSFVMIFCAGVYWSYNVLLRNQSENVI